MFGIEGNTRETPSDAQTHQVVACELLTGQTINKPTPTNDEPPVQRASLRMQTKRSFLMMSELNRKRMELAASGKDMVIGWEMTPAEALAFFQSLRKTVVTFFGYSVAYENEKAMLKIAEDVLARYSPETFLINIGATYAGAGGIYPIAKGRGYKTTGIVSSLAIQYLDDISNDVDHVCFIRDTQWGGKLPGANTLSPTSQAMVACSDILVGIGGGKITRDEMLAGREQGKDVYFHPAEISHAYWIQRAQKLHLPPPVSFLGAAHEAFGSKQA